jgi:hypothetical protein
MLPRKLSPYSQLFARKRVSTYALRNPIYLRQLMDAGFEWIAREERPFLNVLRSPTIGCIVELYALPRAHCIHINSKEGRGLLKKLCYF